MAETKTKPGEDETRNKIMIYQNMVEKEKTAAARDRRVSRGNDQLSPQESLRRQKLREVDISSNSYNWSNVQTIFTAL